MASALCERTSGSTARGCDRGRSLSTVQDAEHSVGPGLTAAQWTHPRPSECPAQATGRLQPCAALAPFQPLLPHRPCRGSRFLCVLKSACAGRGCIRPLADRPAQAGAPCLPGGGDLPRPLPPRSSREGGRADGPALRSWGPQGRRPGSCSTSSPCPRSGSLRGGGRQPLRPPAQPGRGGEGGPLPEDGLRPQLPAAPGEAHPGRHPRRPVRPARAQPRPGDQGHPGTAPGPRLPAPSPAPVSRLGLAPARCVCLVPVAWQQACFSCHPCLNPLLSCTAQRFLLLFGAVRVGPEAAAVGPRCRRREGRF